MTVCIAARSEGMMLLASDRMITTRDIEFEPPVAKIITLTSSLAVMFSGDADLHSEIVQEVMVEIKAKIETNPDVWLKAKDVANYYLNSWNQIRQHRSESKVLVPLNLDRESFIRTQTYMNERLVNTIATELLRFDVPGLDAIICGIDLRHGHPVPTMYVFRDGDLSCADSTGFVAIGSGANHAESQLMLSRHSYKTPNGEALLNVYMAKKAAEVAPGVGTETDFLAIGPGVGQLMIIPEELSLKLDQECKKILQKDDKVRQKARSELNRFLEELAAKKQAQRAQTDTGDEATEGNG